MIRIANIIEEGKLGGPQIRMTRIAAALKGKIDTIILMPKQNSSSFREFCGNQGVPYRVLPLTRITKEWLVAVGYLLFFPIEILLLVMRFRRDRIDIVHVSGGSWQYKGVIAGKLAGKKVLWHLNDTSMPRFIRGIFSLISRLADGFIFASERTKAYYQPLMITEKPGYVIPAPVDTVQFDPQLTYRGDEELLNRWTDRFVVGTTANINPIKGLESLIRSASILNKTLDNAVFVVVGTIYPAQTRYYESLQQLCEKQGVLNIEFVGGRSDIRPLLHRFDAYVCCSNAESSPISVWEAMAMAKPIVSTNVGDVPLYIKDGMNGFIVNIGDSVTMARRLNSIATDKELGRTFGGRCREIAVQELNVPNCAELHLNAYTDILAQ